MDAAAAKLIGAGLAGKPRPRASPSTTSALSALRIGRGSINKVLYRSAALAAVLYLIYISVAVLKVYCPLCLTADAAVIGLVCRNAGSNRRR